MVLALVSGGSAALGVNRYVTSKPVVAAPRIDTVPVLVALEDIPRGASVTADLVKTQDYPKGILPPGALGRVEDALDRAVFVPLAKGEPVLNGKLAPKGAKRGMAALVPDGMRAFTIPTPSAASGVAGFILPGNKVDVLLTLEGRRGSVTTTLVQNLEILAVDQRTDAPADNRIDPNHLRSVTLLVTPDQAAKLGLAHNKGALHLSLRNHRDDQVAVTSPARLAELDEGFREETRVEATPEAPKPLPLPPVRVVTIYRGNRSAERLRIGDAPAPPAESVLAAGNPPMDGSQ
jgi:pilus assembly protein CpaB